MKSSQTLILLIIAAALVGVVYFLSQREESETAAAAAPEVVVLDGVTSATLARIGIRDAKGEEIVLTREDDTWYTDEARKHRVDKAALAAVMAAVEKKIEGTVVSTNEASFTDYEVTETTATRVKLTGEDGKEIADLLIGKPGGTGMNTYVRLAGKNEIVDARAMLSYVFTRADGWRDRSILDFPQDLLSRIEADGTSATYTLAKQDNLWTLTRPSPKVAEMSKVNPIVSIVSTLRALDFEETTTSEQLAELGLNPPLQKYTIVREDRSTSPSQEIREILLVGNQRASDSYYFAKRADQEQVFLISEYQAKTLSTDPVEMAVVLPEPEPETAEDAETTGAVEAAVPEEVTSASDPAEVPSEHAQEPATDDSETTQTEPAEASME